MRSGIYYILNLKNEKVYIGSATNLIGRWRTHLSSLNKLKHHNRYLQRAVTSDGLSNFHFGILEFVDEKNLLLEREQFYIDLFQSSDPTLGYNLCPKAGSSLGCKQSAETCLKKSLSKKGKPNGLLGYRHREESKKKMSEKRRGELHNLAKLNWNLVRAIRTESTGRRGEIKEIAKRYNVSASTIGRILSNKIWSE